MFGETFSAAYSATISGASTGVMELPAALVRDSDPLASRENRGEHLRSLRMESLLPVVKGSHKWTDRTKEVELPVFAGYSFVRMVFSSADRLEVVETHGVVGFVGMKHVGLPIPDGQIQEVRTLLASHLPFEERAFLRVGRRVRIRGGSLDGIEGILCSHDQGQGQVVSLDLIQRSLSVRIQGYELEPA